MQEKRKEVAAVTKSLQICKTYKPVWMQYVELPMSQKSAFYSGHSTELQAYSSAAKNVEKEGIDQSVDLDKAIGFTEQLERKIEELEPKARQLGADASARFEYALAETEKLAVTSRTYWQKFTKFLKKYRWAILTGLVSLVFIATGHPEYILYTLLHLVMIVFAAAHTAIGVLSLIFDNLFGIEIFSSIGYALYNITYAFIWNVNYKSFHRLTFNSIYFLYYYFWSRN